jgi:hypothetical protein
MLGIKVAGGAVAVRHMTTRELVAVQSRSSHGPVVNGVATGS